MKKILVLILFFVSFSALHSADNKWQRPLHKTQVENMAAVGGNIVVGCDDDLFVSVDGGANWTNNTNGILSYTDYIYTSGENLVAYSVNGIAVSKDKGWTWNTKFEGYCLSLIAFGDTLISQTGTQSTGKALLRSTDNGVHWYSIPVEIEPSGVLTKAIRTHNGILSGSSAGLTRTTDGGITWWNEAKPFSGEVFELKKAGQVVMAITSDGVYRSTDDGDSWIATPCNINKSQFESFVGGTACGNKFYACTYNNVFCSEDGGLVWTQINNSVCAAIKIFSFGEKVFLCTFLGLYEIDTKSNDIKLVSSGLTELNVLTLVSTPRRTIAFTAEKMFCTTNSGRNWAEMPGESTVKYISKTVSNGETIIAASYDGHAYRSENSGDTWTEIIPWVGYTYVSIKDLTTNGDYTYITANGNVYYSTDWGVTWHQMINQIDEFISPIKATGRGGEFVVIDNYNDLRYSSDFGSTWSMRTAWGTDNPGIVRAFGSELIIGKYNGILNMSADFGTEWKESDCKVSFTIDQSQGIEKIDNTIYAFSYTGGLMNSTNFGDSWQKDMNGVKQNSVRCFSYDGTTAYLGTGTGGVYCTNFGNVGAYEPIATRDELSITPNPASDAIRIQANMIGAKGSIINAVGETVAVFVTSPGSETRVDVSSLAPGVYFVVSGGNAVKFVKY